MEGQGAREMFGVDTEDGIQGTVASITPGAHWLGARSCAGLHVRVPGGQASRPLCRAVRLIQGAVGRLGNAEA